MPKGTGYKTGNRWDESNAIGVNRYPERFQKTIVIQKQPKALGMGRIGRIGITSMGNTGLGRKHTHPQSKGMGQTHY